MNILLLNGSPNDNGNTYYLLHEIEKCLQEQGADCEIASVHKAVMSANRPFCTACSSPCNQSCYKNTLLEELFEKIAKADCLILGSPVYFGAMTGQLKVLFDKSRALRTDRSLVGKPAGVVTVGASKYGGQETTAGSIIDMLQVQGMTVFNNGWTDTSAGHKGVLAQRPSAEDKNVVPIIKDFAKRAYMEASKYILSISE